MVKLVGDAIRPRVCRQSGFIATATVAILLVILTLIVLSDLRLVRALWVATTLQSEVLQSEAKRATVFRESPM
jgi:hypothetical protein